MTNKAAIALGAVGGISLVAVAIALATRKNPAADEGYLCGYIKDASTGAAIAFASVTLGNESSMTNNQGYYELPLMSTGSYYINILADGYPPYYGEVDLVQGKNTRNYTLSVSGGGGDDGDGDDGGETGVATLTGHVTSYLELRLLYGVTIEIGGKTAVTPGSKSDSKKYPAGTYTIDGLTPGTYTINVSREADSPWGQGPYSPLSKQITLHEGINVWNFAMGNSLLNIPSVGEEGYEIIFGTPRYAVGKRLTLYLPVTNWNQPYPYYSPGSETYTLNGWGADGYNSYYTFHVSAVYEYEGVSYPYDYDEARYQWEIEDPIYWR